MATTQTTHALKDALQFAGYKIEQAANFANAIVLASGSEAVPKATLRFMAEKLAELLRQQQGATAGA